MFTMLKNILQNLTSRPATRLYPFTKREPFSGTRNRLEIDPAVCIYCGICSKRCPAHAITVTKDPAKVWTLDPYRCILCGYCVEVCPKKCLSMSGKHHNE
jgi:ech hydrogenase subunit F